MQEKASILIAIDANDKIWINRRQVDIRSVRSIIERLHAENPEAAAVILELTAADLGAPGDDDVFGAGRVDAAAAVQLAIDAMTTPLAPVARDDHGFATSDAPAAIDVLAIVLGS